MAHGYLGGVVYFLRRLSAGPGHVILTDRDLLRRFAEKNDAHAFGELVRRHGPMVLAASRRVLHDAADIEDAFQATFVILGRRASSVGWQDSIANWLYGVAYRVAVRARNAATVRRRHESQVHDMPRSDSLTETERQELRTLLDEELHRLPEKYRAPLVLCYLEGKTNEEAAQQLGWSKGTVSGRLVRARDLLRARLARRNFVLPAATFAAVLAENTAPASLPSTLLNATIQAATLPAAGALSASAVSLVEGVLRAMLATKLKMIGGVLLGFALHGAGAGVFYHPSVPGGSAVLASPPAVETKIVAEPDADAKVRSKAVRENGVDFAAVADKTWHMPAAGKNQAVDIGLRITNASGKDLSFVLWEQPAVELTTADGKKLTFGYARKATAPPTMLSLAAGKATTVSRSARLEWLPDNTGVRLTGTDDSGGWWWFDDLRAGKYRLSLGYENKEQGEGFWVGKVQTEVVEITVAEVKAALADDEGVVKLTLSSAKKEYRKGEAVDLKLTLENQNKESITINLNALLDLSSVTVVGPNGKPVERANNGVEINRRPRTVKVEAGKSESWENELKGINTGSKVRHTHFPMDAPGTYRLRYGLNGVVSNELEVKVTAD